MIKELFRFQPDKSTIVAFSSGAVMILFSICMLLFPDNEFTDILLRDVLMIYLLGFVFPLYYIIFKENHSVQVLGISKNKIILSLIINIISAMVLLIMFISENDSNTVTFSEKSIYAIVYIFSAGIFEMLFIYGFLRYQFEKAFGIIPSVILTSAFYSLHHAGFQPEFLKLFFVGILYISVFYLTRNIFCIFPFFWGVGATWDVLVNSDAGQEIMNFTSFITAVVIIMMMLLTSVVIDKFNRKTTADKPL